MDDVLVYGNDREEHDKKHQVSIVPKLDYLLYLDRALYPECIAPDNGRFP